MAFFAVFGVNIGQYRVRFEACFGHIYGRTGQFWPFYQVWDFIPAGQAGRLYN